MDEARADSRETPLWVAAAALAASASYLIARYIHLGPLSGPWAYWPINGVLCGLLFRRAPRTWPAIALAAGFAQVGTIYLVRGDLAGGATVFGALGTVVQACLGAWLLRRQRTLGAPLGTARELAWFAIGVVCLVPLAITPLTAYGFARGLGLPFFNAWWPLFVGNALSMLLFAPLFMQRWRRERDERAPWLAHRPEVLLCQGALLLMSLATFGALGHWPQVLALPYLMFPLLAWAALRSGPKWTAVAILTVATVSAWCTPRGLGPFAPGRGGLDDSVAGLQGYLAFVAFTALLLAALTEQHRRAFAELTLQGAVQRAFFESSDAVMILKDLQGRYLLVNRAAEESLGLPRTHLVGRHPGEVLDSAEAGPAVLHDQRVAERGQALTFQETYGTGRERRQMLVTRFPVRDDAGTVRYLGLLARDETNERALHERLNRAQRVELVGQLAAGLAHDLNNLLSIVITNLAVLRARRSWPEEEAEMLQDMREAGERSVTLTQRLLSFGRREEPVRGALEVDAALRALEPLLRALARGSVDVVCQYGAPGVRVVADVSELEQIVLNLVSNARDAISGEGRITLSTERVVRSQPTDARWLQLRVSDTGVGMDAATLAQLFQPFFTTKGPREGTGLGLYTTALLVRELGGEVHATSTPGQGSTFVVGLPLAPEP